MVEFWQCTNNASENAIFLFPVLPGNAETQVIWGGIVKRILIAYFIGSISAKKYQNPFTYVKVIASQMWDVFETRCTYSSGNIFLFSVVGCCPNHLKTLFELVVVGKLHFEYSYNSSYYGCPME